MKDDTVSRQAAIDALDGLCDRECEYSKKQRHTMCGACHLGSAFDVIEQLPLSRENLVNNSNHIVNYLANDTISRQAAIDVIDAILPVDPMKNEYTQGITCGAALAIEYVKQLPSAQPEPQWIPCSERLPEVDESVLVTTEWNDISIAWRTGIDEWLIHEGNTNVTTDDLTAWMPLPEPWKGEKL